jgi:hypothetical protein
VKRPSLYQVAFAICLIIAVVLVGVSIATVIPFYADKSLRWGGFLGPLIVLDIAMVTATVLVELVRMRTERPERGAETIGEVES